ncbi:MAG: hypothetical protein QOH04_2192 [Sphingomonadales bacterium]|jgi:hypothetical protein|nr:hypothetical protein [Sphingomonadales bacterium]
MQPSYSSIGQIFSAQTRYVVPLFQRPYVWAKEDQWQPLYEDIEELADRVLDPPPHKPVAGHFLGTAVLEQVMVPAVEMPQRRIIDGQQRLTTLQIVLKAAVEALRVCGPAQDEDGQVSVGQAVGRLELLCANQFASSDEARFKVWPTNDDRDQFRAVLEWVPGTPMPTGTRMAEAFSFFRSSLLEWLGRNRTPARALALSAAMTDHLRMIVLDLDQFDEPQAIFETLNAHGTPLLPADLVKNWLLWEAGKQSVDASSLYGRYWADFDKDTDYWRKVIGTGHAARPRVDTFLQNWLTLETLETVSAKHLYDRFLAFATTTKASDPGQRLDLPTFMDALRADALRYREIDEGMLEGEAGERIRRLNRLDYVVFRPALIGLLRYRESSELLLRGTTALESYLVRRMVCGEQTRGYGKVALDLVAALQRNTADRARCQAMLEVLRASGWPDDERYLHFWTKSRFYGWFRRTRVLTLLQAIEIALQKKAHKSERLSVGVDGLTIEHIMPQSWQTNWPLTEDSERMARDPLVQNIGNLTLVNDRLNPALSNAPWLGGVNCKKLQLEEHSKLELNRKLLAQAGDDWTDAKIAERAKFLFEIAREIWPAHESMVAALP